MTTPPGAVEPAGAIASSPVPGAAAGSGAKPKAPAAAASGRIAPGVAAAPTGVTAAATGHQASLAVQPTAAVANGGPSKMSLANMAFQKGKCQDGSSQNNEMLLAGTLC
jgi:hypothetical protein